MEDLGLQPGQCAMVGDRLYTDIEMACQAGVVGILVLSGEATLADLEGSGSSPDLVVDSVASLLK